jgi:hypothetical protein
MSWEPIEIPVTRFKWLPKGCPLRCFYADKDIHLEGDWINPGDPEAHIQEFPIENLTVWLDTPGELRYFIPVILRHHFNIKGEPSVFWIGESQRYFLLWPVEALLLGERPQQQVSGGTVEECFLAALRVVFP